jgi:glucosamine--fructose-6-phosphate aminotransferase (isomerizing)
VSALDVTGFLADLEAKPDALRRLAEIVRSDDPWRGLPSPLDRVVLLGMGSSHYAGSVAAARLRHRGIAAVADLASSDLLPRPSDDTVIVAVSASGESAETVDAASRYIGRCPVVALVNETDSTLARAADVVVPMHAGRELGGVACRSYLHTLAMLLALEERLAASSTGAIGSLVQRAADAAADLLERRDEWLPQVRERLVGPDGVYAAAPARRMASAQQAALMLREGPRLAATGCETGDWSHVDVYLTKTLDYRLLIFPGSRWDDALLRWTTERGSTVVAVGAHVPAAQLTVRYRGDDDDDVRLLTEVLVAELVAHDAWDRGDP